MTNKDLEKIGAIADYKYVDWGDERDDISGWIEEVKAMNIISEEDLYETYGGWYGLFKEALEWC